MKVLVACNTLSEVDSQVYPSHMVNAFRMGRDTDVDFILCTPRRMPIDTARNQAVKAALRHDCEYVFFYDDDMELNANCFKTLLSRDKDIIMAMSYIRGYPFRPMVFKWVDKEDQLTSIADVKADGRAITLWEDCEDSKDDEGIIHNAAAVGCACTLIKTDVFRKMNYPWFYTGTANTEDVYFCIKAQNAIPDLEICVDTTVPAGHVMKDRDVLYPSNADFLRKKHDEANNIGAPRPDETEKTESGVGECVSP